MKASVNDLMPQAMTADFMVSAHGTIDRARMEGMSRVDDMVSVRRYDMVGASVGSEQTVVTAAKPEDYGQLVRQAMESGRPAKRAYELVVNHSVMQQKGWKLGQRVSGVVQGHDVTWTIVGTFAYPPNVAMSEYYIHPETLTVLGVGDQPAMIAVKAAEGADLDRVAQGLRSVTSGLSGAQVIGLEEYRELAGAQVNAMVGGVYALIALSIVIAAFGIVNTLGLSVVERRRELGLLRAVGMTRGQVRGLILRESLMIAVVGGCRAGARVVGRGWAAGAHLRSVDCVGRAVGSDGCGCWPDLADRGCRGSGARYPGGPDGHSRFGCGGRLSGRLVGGRSRQESSGNFRIDNRAGARKMSVVPC